MTLWLLFFFFFRGFNEWDTTSGNDRIAKARDGSRKQNDWFSGHGKDKNEQ